MSNAPRFEILDHCDTPLGALCLRRRKLLSKPGELVTEVTLDQEFLMSSYNTVSERALAERALALHPGTGLRAVVGGLGLGYTAREVLESPRVARVEVVELLPQVISWLERGLLPLADELTADSRLHVMTGDIYRRLHGAPAASHDLILIDVDHNPEEPLHPDNLTFYTVDGLTRAREHLAPGGILAVWSSAEDVAFVDALEQVFAEVRVEAVVWWNDLIDEEQRDDLFLARR